MSACPCGCTTPVKPGNRYASAGCGGRVAFRAIPHDVRVARSKAYCARIGPEALRARASKGGRSSDVARWAALLEIWQTLSPREALRAAYQRGYLSGYDAGRARTQRGKSKWAA